MVNRPIQPIKCIHRYIDGSWSVPVVIYLSLVIPNNKMLEHWWLKVMLIYHNNIKYIFQYTLKTFIFTCSWNVANFLAFFIVFASFWCKIEKTGKSIFKLVKLWSTNSLVGIYNRQAERKRERKRKKEGLLTIQDLRGAGGTFLHLLLWVVKQTGRFLQVLSNSIYVNMEEKWRIIFGK